MCKVIKVLLIAIAASSSVLGQQDLTELSPLTVFESEKVRSVCDALAANDYSKVKELVQAGVDIDARGHNGLTPLFWCWCKGDHRDFELLLELGADPHVALTRDLAIAINEERVQIPSGCSVAQAAILFAREQSFFVEKCIRYLRDAKRRDSLDRTLLFSFMTHNDQPQLRPPVKSNNVAPAAPGSDKAASYIPTRMLQVAPFALLYHAGVPVDAVDSSGLTALQVYLRKLDRSKQQEISIDLRASLTVGLFSHTRYHDKAHLRADTIQQLERLVTDPSPRYSSHSYVRSLKSSSDADYDQQEAEGRIGFFDMDHLGKLAFYKMMFCSELPDEANLMLQGESFPRIPHKPRSLSELFELGLDAKAVGKAGYTLLIPTFHKNDEVAFRELLQHGADVDTQLTEDLWEFVSPGIQNSAGACFSPEKGETVLLTAALNPFGREPYLSLGLKHTKSPDIRDALDRNMLHRILFHRLPENHRHLLKDLVDAGVDLNAQSIGGATPAHHAVFRNATLIPELVALGANLELRDIRGRTVRELLRESIEQKWTFYEESVSTLQLLDRSPK